MSKFDELNRRLGSFAEESLTPLEPAGGPAKKAELPERLQGLVRSKDTAEIPVDRIIADAEQPREVFDDEALDRLAASLRTRGVLQPLRVRWCEDQGRYILIAGERRWRAAIKAGLERVPCVIHQGGVDPGELLSLQLIENVLREDLRPVEQAKGYKRLMESRGWSAGRIAEELHVPKSTITRSLELLDLPEPVQDLVEQGALAPSAAAEIGRLGVDRVEDQVELARQTAEQQLPRAAVVEAVKARKEGRATPVKSARVEIRLDDGHKISITGPMADAGDEALAEVLRHGLKQIQARIRAAAKGQGQAA